MLSSAVGYACNMMLVHIIASEVPPIVNLHQSNLGFIMASGILCSFNQERQLTTGDVTIELVLVIIGVSVTGFLTQLFIIRANSYAKPSLVMPFGYVSVACGFLADIFLFGTSFTLLAIVGMMLTSAGLLGSYLNDKFGNKSGDSK